MTALPGKLSAEFPSRMRAGLARFWRHRGFVLGLALLSVIVLTAVLAPLLAPHDP
ncbi:MAG: N-terminal domain of oligopeptide transport permease, partial [Alphaproteobacteria bacterium]|nr:N-terminal domain of oligopeptide transport permease [Alphaproteobacteria bacterium]